MKMRRPISYLTALVILALAAVVSFRAALLHRSGERENTAAVADPPSQSPIKGPYFSNQNRVGERIIAAINKSQGSIDVAMYSLTEPSIAAALEAAARRGVHIRIVADAGQSQGRHSEIPFLREAGIAIRLSGGYRGRRSLMHDKFAVFDRREVETGSFNWTTSADDYNYENAIFIVDSSIAKQYENEFEVIWTRALLGPAPRVRY